MIDLLGKKSRGAAAGNALLAFVQSWDVLGADEVSVCSGALDVLRVCLGERPCCVWTGNAQSLTKVSERGVVEAFYAGTAKKKAALARALVTGACEFDACDLTTVEEAFKISLDGFLHIPVKSDEGVMGLLSLGVSSSEARDRAFVEPLSALGRLVAMALRFRADRESREMEQRRLKSEVNATTRELELTNQRLIERVKDLKGLSQELQNRVRDLEHANKAKDEFLSVVSHELRTPLTSLNGFLAVVLEEEAGPLTAEQRKFLKIAKSASDRLNFLIGDLLDISRIESGRLQLEMDVCPIYDVLRACYETLAPSANAKGLRIEFEASPFLPTVWGDRNRLYQVVDALVSNAIKFTEPGGTVRVTAADKADAVQVDVIDTGPGLTPEEQKRVFDKFYQVDSSNRRASGGAGLGLSIAQGIVAMHGGRLWVESQKGKGSRFVLFVPRSKAKQAA